MPIMPNEVGQGRAIGLGEKLFAVCSLLYASSAFIRLLMGEDQYATAGEDTLASPVKRVVWPIIYLLGSYFLVKHCKPHLGVLRKVPLLAALLSCVAASILWSDNRLVSVISVGALLGNTLLGVYFGVRYSVRGFLHLLGRVYAIIVAGSFLARIAIGSGAIVDGSWAGFFTQRNGLGMHAAIGVLIFAMLARGEGRRRPLWVVLMILSCALLLLSGSATAAIALVAVACGYAWLAFLKGRVRSASLRVLSSAVIVFSLVAVVFWHWDALLSMIGKTPDMTGRTEIWGASLLMVQDRPLFGYGYGGFWVYGGPAQAIWDSFGDLNSSYAHDGYLEILLDTGGAGLCLLLALVYSAFRKARTYARLTTDTWPLCLFAFMAFHNLGEATYVERNNLFWLLFVAVFVQLVGILELQPVPAVESHRAPFQLQAVSSEG